MRGRRRSSTSRTRRGRGRCPESRARRRPSPQGGATSGRRILRAEGDERCVSGYDLDERLPAARGSGGPAPRRVRNASRAAARARSGSPARLAVGIQPGSKRAAPTAGSKLPGRLVGGLREVARPGDAQPLRVGDDERARRVRPAEPLLAGDRQEVEAVRSRPGSRPTDWAPSTSIGHARALAQLVHGEHAAARPEHVRDGEQAACAASPRRGLRPGRRRPRRRGRRSRAPARVSPKCSSRVMTTSSSGPRSSPARTMLQPSVVEPVSETCSGSTPTSAAERRAHVRSQLQEPVEVRLPDSAALNSVCAQLLHRVDRRPGERPEGRPR